MDGPDGPPGDVYGHFLAAGAGLERLDHPVGDVGDEVAEPVDVDDAPLDGLLAHGRLWDRDLDVVLDLIAEGLRLHVLGEPRRHGGKDVPAVEGRADLVEEVAPGGQFDAAAEGRVGEGGREDPVVGPDEGVAVGEREDGPPLAADRRVHDDEVDRPLREVAVGGLEDEGALEHVVARDLVGDVHEPHHGVDGDHHPLHGADVWAGLAEVGDQSDDGTEGLGHGCSSPAGPTPTPSRWPFAWAVTSTGTMRPFQASGPSRRTFT